MRVSLDTVKYLVRKAKKNKDFIHELHQREDAKLKMIKLVENTINNLISEDSSVESIK